ncbi:MAG: DegT/DnrJ/EryC1/StrS family aminotransferase [Nitrososphaerota archaeon]|nr:DegT/DnrJ/EryC1/StrS family aminotransferase [Candidatus Calditenuaceae archaeon]MDW8072866.1 DegT/DnrJ/EryC1/StrS family aminotransferase [Nitrososphaerota archaeon]
MLAIKGGEPVRTKPFPSWPVWGREEEEMLLSALRSGTWGLGGQLVAKFSEAFARYSGCNFGVACMNGTTALKVALKALGVGAGERVLTTPYTFLATSSVILELGALPVYVDIVEGGVNIDPRLVHEAVDGDIAAILLVHVGGHPVEMDLIDEVSRTYGVPVLEDAAEAHGTEWKGRRAGSMGVLGCFSFQSSKVMTSGEGGIITTNDAELAEVCASLINCGRSKGRDWYENDILGYNYRMTEFQAAILLSQLSRLDEQIERRQKNFEELLRLCRELEGFKVIQPPAGTSRNPNYLVIVQADSGYFKGIPKKRIVDALRAEGIPASYGWPVPLYRYPPIRRYLEHHGVKVDPEEFPNTERAASEFFFIHHRVLLGGYGEVSDIYEALRKIERNADDVI